MIEDEMVPYRYDEIMETRKWAREIPYIQFPAEWKIQIIPPFCGAVVRFRVRLPDGREKSSYLDCYNRLGYYGRPYWEVYPVENDVFRCGMNEVDELLEAIAK